MDAQLPAVHPTSSSALEVASAELSEQKPLRRQRPSPFYPVLMEVAGYMENDAIQQMSQRLRRYRNRYSLLLRCVFTLVANNTPEAVLFGDNTTASIKTNALLASPKYVLSVNKIYPLLRRLHLLTRPEAPAAENAWSSLFWCNGGSDANVEEELGADHPLNPMEMTEISVSRLEAFMAYYFLPFAMLHNTNIFTDDEGPTSSKRGDEAAPSTPLFVLRQYINEACRTTSFLLLDPHRDANVKESGGGGATASTAAVLIDPREEMVANYEEDLARFGATVSYIIFTHCYVDGASGLAQLLQRYPAAIVVSGLPLHCPGTVVAEVNLGSVLRLRSIAVGAFSRESIVVELYYHGVLLSLFTGVVWSFDAAPRSDLYFWTAPATAADRGAARSTAISATQECLLKCMYDVYFRPLSIPFQNPQFDFERASSLQRVVVMPSHGGYSNVSNQLDLYWGAHIGDLMRMRHSRNVIDSLISVEAFTTHSKKVPSLPHTPLMNFSRVCNLASILDAMTVSEKDACIASLSLDMQHAYMQYNDDLCQPQRSSGALRGIYVNVIDVRDAVEYHKWHLMGSVNVPMSFPGAAYGAKRAELWLQCLLLPNHPVAAICSAESQRAEVHRRLSALSPNAAVEVYTVDQLRPSEWVALCSCQQNDTDASHAVVIPRPVFSKRGSYLPPSLTWICEHQSLQRLAAYEQLIGIEPAATRIILDVRTPYEFRNGSHQASVHVQLSELCQIAVDDARDGDKADAETVRIGPSSHLADRYMEHLHTTGLVGGLPLVGRRDALKEVAVYCAGGYRSLIALSLLRRAMEMSGKADWHETLMLTDVAGGAFQIMTQRPDLWQVKDRSIICIS